jgi:hypothetical protein
MASPTSLSLLVLLDNLPVLAEGENRHPALAERLSQHLLRWIGERDHKDLSKIYMPLTPLGASYG